MPKLRSAREFIESATPGPWKEDSGNGEVESANEKHSRIVICVRPDLVERVKDYERKGLLPEGQMCAHPDWDMEFVAWANPALLRKLVAVAEMAMAEPVMGKKLHEALLQLDWEV